MKEAIRNALKRELSARGFSPKLAAPYDTLVFDESYLRSVGTADLFEMLVARREKIFASQHVVGREIAKKGYADVVLAIDAVRAVIEQLDSAA